MKNSKLAHPTKRHGLVSIDSPCIKKRMIWFEAGLLWSKAYRALKTPACYVVYGIFKTKCQVENMGTKRSPQWKIVNNGQIIFTYKDLEDKDGISEGQFHTAIVDLIDKGFIDIEKRGSFYPPNPTLYRISDRWDLYGTKGFVKKTREKRINNKGFKKGNQYGQNCSPEAKVEYHKQVENEKEKRHAPKRAELTKKLKNLEKEKGKLEQEKQKLSRIAGKVARLDKIKRKLAIIPEVKRTILSQLKALK